MAIIKGVNQTKWDAGGLSNQMAAGTIGGRVKVAFDTVVSMLATQTTATDVLELFGELPAGAKILMITLMVSGTQSGTISVGTNYLATEFHAAAADDLQTAEAVMHVPGHQYVVGTNALDNQIIITFAAEVGDAGRLDAAVYYTTD